MKKLLYTTTAFVLCGGIVQANAACIATPSCTAMGYTSSSSCTNGIKCPFGEAWNCSINDIKTEITELKNTIEQQQKESCAIGSILYSDMSCSISMLVGKEPIGIVVYADETGGGQALALKSIGTYAWGNSWGGNEDRAVLDNLDAEDARKDFSSCLNTKKILDNGDKSIYPAAWAAHEYSTEGTNAGDWCLPAAGILYSYVSNQAAINSAFSRTAGVMPAKNSNVWSSTEYNEQYAWFYDYSKNSIDNGYNTSPTILNYPKSSVFDVYPVLEFPIKSYNENYAESCDGYTIESCSLFMEPTGSSCHGKYKGCACEYGYYYDYSARRCVSK